MRAPPAKKTVQADWVRVGRNASCEIHLPDARVPLEQGMLVLREGLVYLEGEAGSQDITRKSVRSVRLAPGTTIDVGPYRLACLAPPEGYDGAVAVELVRPAESAADLRTRAARVSLAAVGLSRRGVAWALAIGVLLVGLVLPAGRVLHLPWQDASAHPVLGDRLWDAGPLLLAHQPIATQCSRCHERAFVAVRDAACAACHAGAGPHVGPALLRTGLFAGTRCTDCHAEHKGTRAVYRDDDRACVACHSRIRSLAPGTEARDASDFAGAHPAFRLLVPGAAGLRRVRQGAGPIVQETHLAFSHAKHLDPKGVRSPDRGRVALDCAACHVPDRSGRGFEPITMARDCQSCHRLRFEPAVTAREVPHGKVQDAVTTIREFYASLALEGTPDSFQKAFGVPGEGLLRRAGTPRPAGREAALAMARRKADAVARDLVEKRVCKTCHALAREAGAGDTRWKVAPVRIANHWMPDAAFDHRAHAAQRCASCHDVAKSKASSDVAMPTIVTCRRCHSGARPVAGKVPSNCLLCHGFHRASHPWDPGYQPPAGVRRMRTAADAR